MSRYNRIKICTKNLHEMTPENTGKKGICLACRKAYRRQWRLDHPGYNSKYYQDTKDRRNKLARERRKRNPDKVKQYYKVFMYGLSEKKYQEILGSQNGVCVCGKPFDQNHHKPCVDHDHKCCPGDRSCGKCVRGILGKSCNIILGYVEDSVDRLALLVEYFRRKQ